MNFRNILHFEELRSAFAHEFFTSTIANWALEDLAEGMPKSARDWDATTERAVPSNSPKEWLLILPSAHSVAGLYPLMVGLNAGLKLYVRLPSETAYRAAKLVLEWLYTPFQDQLEILEPSFRLGTSKIPETVGGIFAFGGMETIDCVRKTRLKAVCYGDACGISMLAKEDILKDPTGACLSLVRDAFSLGQKGCMSAKAVIMLGDFSQEERAKIVKELAFQARLTIGPLPINQQVLLDQEVIQWLLKGAELSLRRDKNEPIIPFFSNASSVGHLSSASLTLPCYFYNYQSIRRLLALLLENIRSIKHISLSPSLYKDQSLITLSKLVRCVPLGLLGRPLWDGTHQGQRLFEIN